MSSITEVKICGITNEADALMALECGADYLGFVLYEGSQRGITPTALMQLVDRLPTEVRKIGVFVNEDPDRVEVVADDCGLYAVQLHGDERARDFSGCKCTVWRAVRFVKGLGDADPDEWNASRYVVDAAVSGKYGGTGELADWSLATDFAGKHEVMLAGGLTVENVEEAVQAVKPIGVDVAGGVEKAYGVKDSAKVRAFIENAKKA